MSRYGVFVLAGLLGLMTAVLAQESLVGKYTGAQEHKTQMGKIEFDTVTLTIDKIDGGNVQGKVTRFQGYCNGDYPVAGVLAGDKLSLRLSSREGVKPDCGLSWELTVKGNKLEGKAKSGDALRFSK